MNNTEAEVACPAEDRDGTHCLKLFFVSASVQTVPVSILADSGSVRNLISETFFSKLLFKPPVQPVGDVQVVCGNGRSLDLRGFVVLPTTIGKVVLQA